MKPPAVVHIALSLFGTLLLIARPALADHLSVEQAKCALDSAEQAVCQVSFDISHARSALDQALANQSSAASNLAGALAQIDTSRRCIATAQASLDAAARDLPAAGDRAAAAKSAFDAAKARADAAAAEVAKYQGAAKAAFESSPAFKAIAADLSSSQTKYDQEVAATLDWLRSTDVYLDMYDRIEEIEADLQAERNRYPANPPMLSAISNAWMDAKNELERFKADVINNDADVRQAKQRLDAVAQSQKELVARFNKDLANDPNLRDLMVAADTEAQSAKTSADAANNAQADVSAREQEIARLQTLIANETARVAQAERDAGTWQALANQYACDAANADGWLRGLWQTEWSLRRQRDCAADAFRLALARRDDDLRHRRDDDRHREDQARHDREERERQKRENAVAVDEKSGRNALTARHARDRDEQDQRSRAYPGEAARQDAQLTEARRQRELDQQRRQLASDRAAADLQRDTLTAAHEAPAKSELVRAQAVATPAPILADIQAPFQGPKPPAPVAAPPAQPKAPAVAEKPEREAKDLQQREAQARSKQENQQREAQVRDEQTRRDRETQTRAEQERQQRESSSEADRDREARSRANEERQQREAQSHAQQERQDREAQSRAQQERHERETQSRAETDRRESEQRRQSEQRKEDSHSSSSSESHSKRSDDHSSHDSGRKR
jgi:hypothetical protein